MAVGVVTQATNPYGHFSVAKKPSEHVGKITTSHAQEVVVTPVDKLFEQAHKMCAIRPDSEPNNAAKQILSALKQELRTIAGAGYSSTQNKAITVESSQQEEQTPSTRYSMP